MKIQNAFRLGLFGGLGVLLAIAIGGAITTLATILTYIGAAIFLALGLDPLVTLLEKHRFPRWAATLTVVLGVLAVFAGMIFAIVPVIVDQTRTVIGAIPEVVKFLTTQNWVADLSRQLGGVVNVQGVLDSALKFVSDPAKLAGIGGGVLQVGIGIASGAFGVLIVLILTLYFVASLNGMKRGLYQLVPSSKRAAFADIAEQISRAVGRYVVGQVALALCNGVLSFIFLSVIGVRYSALLAFVAFLFSLIPLVGTISGSVVIALAVLAFNGWPIVLFVIIYYLIYMQVEAYLLGPNIMNRAVKVPGVVVVIAALAGGTLLGILGALIAIPVAASILLIIDQVIIPRQNTL
ncbi:MAG: AI-2E family transporter [Microbacteriaceae bacterium]